MPLFEKFLCVLCLGMPLLAGAPPASADALQTLVVELHDLPDEQRFTGVVEAVHRSTISAQTAGEIIELPFDVNDYVPKDAVFVRFDDTRQKAQLDRAVASHAQAEARLAEAQSRYQRNQRLIEQNAVSKSELEKSLADLKSARAQLDQAAAAHKEAQEQLEYTVVRAPFAGVVEQRLVEIGEHAQVGTPLGTGLSLEKLRVTTQVPGRHVDAIRASASARVQLRPGADAWLETQALTVFPVADPDSHSFTVRAELPPGQHGLYPGMLVKMAFEIGRRQHLAVPTASIVHRSEVTGVYVVGPDEGVRFRQIREGRPVMQGMTVVLAGLQAGERVALDPVAAVIRLKQQGAGQADE